MRSIAFVVPSAGVWPLPLYELVLLTATHLEQSNIGIKLVFVTPEPSPLSLFGPAASDAVRELLVAHDIGLHTGCHPSHYEAGQLQLVPRATVRAERVVALPRLEGLRIFGLPQDDDGFIATDRDGRVHEVEDVYAAGDITRFPIKQGGLAAQQADAVAEALAARAGAPITPHPFQPLLRGLLLTGGPPRYLRSDLRGGRGETGTAGTEALWWPPAKIVGRYLAPYLARTAGFDLEPPADQSGLPIEINLPIEYLQ